MLISDLFPVISWHQAEVLETNLSMLLDFQYEIVEGLKIMGQGGFDDISADFAGFSDDATPTIPAYVLAAMVRGLVVGFVVLLVTAWFVRPDFAHPLWILVFAVLGSAILGTMGLIAGIWAEKFDQIAAFQNFIIMPLTFLSGVFYSVKSLPGFWQTLSHLNPFFYMVDGFRYGFFGVSDVPPATSLAVVAATLAGVSAIALRLLASGYRLRH